MSNAVRTNRFRTIGTDGKEYVVIVETIGGAEVYRTLDGDAVEREAQGLYRIVSTGVTLSPLTENAP